MGSKTFNQEFNGYWIERNISGLPASSGIYCVYEGQYNSSNNTVGLLKLIYIGESGNVQARVANHERTHDWKKHVRYGNELVFSSTLIKAADRERVEAALIYEHKPPVSLKMWGESPIFY